jgi:hypothetical protein
MFTSWYFSFQFQITFGMLGRYGLSGCPVARYCEVPNNVVIKKTNLIFDPQTMRMCFEKTMVGE